MRSSLLICALCLMLSTAPARAEVDSEEVTIQLLVGALGTPASERAVDVEVARVRGEGEDAALRLATALARAGGPAAVDGLADLLRARSDAVRVRALEALTALGLRSAALDTAVFEAAVDEEASVRVAALRALGRIGSGEHIPVLTRALDDDQVDVRRAAHEALRSMTGVSYAAVPARWSNWWAQFRKRTKRDLNAALALVGELPSKDAIAPLRRIVHRYGWAELATVQGIAREFLRAGEPRLQVEGCRIAQALRLADLGDDVHRLYRYTRDKAALRVAHECIEELRIPVRRKRGQK